MAREGETKVFAGSAREATSIKGERELEEAFANGELAKPGELAPHITSMRSRSESAREAFRGEEMEKGGEGEAFAFRELRICAPGGEKRGEGEAEPCEKGGELARSSRSARAHGRRSEEEGRRSHEREKGEGGERREGSVAKPQIKAKLEKLELLALKGLALYMSPEIFPMAVVTREHP